MTSKEYNEQVLKAIIHGTTNPKQKRDGCSVTESQIQIACVDWFKLQYRQLFEDGVLFHIPNERQCSYALGARLKREGVVKGVADLCLALMRHGYGALYIEMKKPGSYQRPEQKTWEQSITRHGYLYKVIKNFDDFKKLIDWYVNYDK